MGKVVQTGRQERTVKWSEFKEATVVAQIGSLERDKESHVTHIKGCLKVSKPKEKAKVGAGAHFHRLHSFTEQRRSELNCAASQSRALKRGKSQKRAFTVT